LARATARAELRAKRKRRPVSEGAQMLAVGRCVRFRS
jgi:hypothetical protein